MYSSTLKLGLTVSPIWVLRYLVKQLVNLKMPVLVRSLKSSHVELGLYLNPWEKHFLSLSVYPNSPIAGCRLLARGARIL